MSVLYSLLVSLLCMLFRSSIIPDFSLCRFRFVWGGESDTISYLTILCVAFVETLFYLTILCVAFVETLFYLTIICVAFDFIGVGSFR